MSNSVLTLVTVGAVTAGAGVAVGVVAPTDWSGIAQALQALGVLILAIGTAVTGVIQVRQKKVLDEVKKGVDGVTSKLVEAKTGEARAVATLEEQAAQRATQGVADAATLKEQARVAAGSPVVTPAAEAIKTTPPPS